MKIGIEGRTLQGRRYGVARYTQNLLCQFVEIDPDSEYIVYLSEDIEPLGFSSSSLRLEVIGSERIPLAWRHIHLPLAMRQESVDLHFSPSYFLPVFTVCPSIDVVHDLYFKAHPEWFVRDKRMRFDDLFWRVVKKADRIITVSEHSKKEIERFLAIDPDRVSVIYEAADERFEPLRDEALLASVRRKYGLDEGFLFTAGSIHTRRNLEGLIDAVGRAGREMGGVSDTLHPGYAGPVQSAGGHRAGRGVGGPGRKGHPQGVRVRGRDAAPVQRVRHVCLPFDIRWVGLPVIEAMACGAPVACSNVTSLPEMGGDAVVYFDPMDVEGMAGAISRVMSDDALRESLSEAGIRRAATFSWRRAAEETLVVFNEVAR
jgi:glycosyltransferase involved in cell wall biosynthesis